MFLDTPLQLALGRNRQRSASQQVDDHVIYKMANLLELPSNNPNNSNKPNKPSKSNKDMNDEKKAHVKQDVNAGSGFYSWEQKRCVTVSCQPNNPSSPSNPSNPDNLSMTKEMETKQPLWCDSSLFHTHTCTCTCTLSLYIYIYILSGSFTLFP